MPDLPLLPCPFCGKAMMLRGALWPAEGDRDAVIHAGPTDCPLYDFANDTFDGSIVEVWNRRAALSDQAARIAELIAADEVRVRDISRLTVERDASRAECEGLRSAAVPAETLRQLDMLFERTTQGSWRTYQNGVHPVEVGGMGSGGDYAICTHGPKSYANADWIATMHDEWPRIRAALSQKETGA